ncbi:MAG: AbgT family transporter [Bacteroidaceae bacterium]|nr:AbgT family transporter [Bacteroidaceae bacterium]
MSNRRLLYYPAVAYTVLLAGIWLLSWVMAVVNLLHEGGAEVVPLVSAEGLRWAVRSATASIENIPWGAIMLFVTSMGLLAGSGMVRSARALMRRESLSFIERRAWLSAAVALLLYLFLLFVGTVYPWNIFMGVTGSFIASPIVQGGAIIAFVGLLFVTAVYGFVYGNYRSMVDVARSVGDAFSLFAPALVALLPASGIVPCTEYTGLFLTLDIAPQCVAVAADIIYLLPFLYTLYFCYRSWGEK